MRLSEHMVDSGDMLFRWRSYVPLVLLPLLLLPMWLAPHPPVSLWWKLLAAAVAIAGELLRFAASGLAPEGTSERVDDWPARGDAQHERHLLRRPPPALHCEHDDDGGAGDVSGPLGAAGDRAARQRPVLRAHRDARGSVPRHAVRRRVPRVHEPRSGDRSRFSNHTPSTRAFSVMRALEREFNGILAIAASLYLLDLVEASSRSGTLQHVNAVWTWFLAAAAALFVLMVIRKQMRARPAQPAT
jgi:hypothetical protein